ncbi:glycosyltransferase family 4 protein [Pediococcus sp. M21F004]|uniref:glycosyltransferase family 4 protein n=1 Tax=Pediococcus sp. M21F004 TaxID=3390033 RepID=UPI003DA78316
MKNILYLHAGSEMYGSDKILLELVTGLNKKSFHPIVVLPSTGVLETKMLEANIEVHVVDYPILRRKYMNFKGILKYCYFYRQSIKKILNTFKGRKIDLIHINTLAVLEGIALKRKLRVPLIWHVHEIILRPRIVFFVTSFLAGMFSEKIVAVSKPVKQHLINSKLISAKKIVIIHNGIDNNIYSDQAKFNYIFDELEIPENSVRVGMIGRINAWKGQKDFLNAMFPLLKKNKNLYAFLLGGTFDGEKWRREELEVQIKSSGVKSQIRLLDFRKDTASFYNFFDIFVLPSTNPDPLPTVVLEAMASGKSIVGYRHGGITEMVGEKENGLLAEPGNVPDLSKKINTLIGNKQLRIRYGDNSKIKEEKYFSLETFLLNFSKLYQNLTSS